MRREMIDFHCHLDLYPHPHALLEKCEREGIYVLSVTTTPSAWRGTLAMSKGAKRVRTALGLHPELAHERSSELALFDKLLPEARYVGEIGLDHTPGTQRQWTSQKSVFKHILRSCQAAGGRVMSIHSRRATECVLDQLEEFPRAGVPVLHWFSGTLDELRRADKLGCWFSVGPSMLNGARGRRLVSCMPRERVLTESDGPFARLGERAAEPSDIRLAILEMADLWKLRESETHNLVMDNFRRLCSQAEH
jgi:TatD DNase family protein